jgi:UDP-N-acetylglucosamine--N-acetylmuramyl-(pentapeptide) pyrophosphoryl-undecaprenol N-acetylglucosamine transferase
MIKRAIISGGGTGGHIYPAISIAQELQQAIPEIEILFVGAQGKMEMEKVPKAGYQIEGLWISGLQRKLSLSNVSFPFKVVSSLYKSRQIIKKFKPDIAIGVGGFASGPLLYMAANMGIPTLIHEQNSYAGITNKLLSKKATRICVAYDSMERFFPAQKIIKTGNPVRKDILHIDGKKDIAIKHFGLDSNKKTILIIGGSLGARTINETIKADIQKLKESGIQVIWQTGGGYYSALKHLHGAPIHIFDFIYQMDLAYAAADVVISRAGASSISELAIVGKPTILVPSPNVAEDHQTKNAEALTKVQAAILVKDMDAKAFLTDQAIALINNPSLQKQLSDQIKLFAIPDAAKRILNEIQNICS